MHFLQEPQFWSALAFVLFFVIFGKKIWRPLAAMLDKRSTDIQAELEEVSRLHREAEEIYTNARKEHEAAKIEAEKMLEASKEIASRVAEKAKKEAELTAERHEVLLRQRMAAAEHDAVLAVRKEAADIAIKTAREVIISVMTEEKDRNLIDRAIAEVPKVLTGRHYVS